MRVRLSSLPFLLACCGGGPSGEGDLFGEGGSSPDPGGSPTSDGEDGGENDDEDGGGSVFDVGGSMFDVGNDDTGDGSGCRKVDFLFVVDNSSSMFAHQEALSASFPGFVSAITERVESDDFHIMVVDTDTKADPSDGCGECYDRCVASPGTAKDCGFPDPNDTGAPNICNGRTCAEISPEPPDACDYVLGAGVIDDRWEQPCDLATADRYLTSAQPDLGQTFECIGRTGVYGTGKELPMGAMVEAVSMNGPGECNEGFVRDDAILVVTILSDALFAGEAYGPPEPWFDALATAKNGDPEAIVVLALLRSDPALVPGPPCLLGASLCGEGAATSCDTTYDDLVAMFGERGFAHSICVDDYEPFFSSALDTIELTCDEFEPEG